jgi:hypothetical protein
MAAPKLHHSVWPIQTPPRQRLIPPDRSVFAFMGVPKRWCSRRRWAFGSPFGTTTDRHLTHRVTNMVAESRVSCPGRRSKRASDPFGFSRSAELRSAKPRPKGQALKRVART